MVKETPTNQSKITTINQSQKENPTPNSYSLQLENRKVSKSFWAENPNFCPRDTNSFTSFSRDVFCYVTFPFSFLSVQLAFCLSSPGWQSFCQEPWLVKKTAKRQWHCLTNFIWWWVSSHGKISQAILPLLHFHSLPQKQHEVNWWPGNRNCILFVDTL